MCFYTCQHTPPKLRAGSTKLSTTTAREQNRALGPQVYGRYPNPGKHRKIISTIALRTPDLLQSPEMARPGISTKNTEKIPPRPEILEPQENTEKIPPKYQKMRIFGIFSVCSWGSRISGRGVFFRYFSWKFRVGPSRGSVAGRGVLYHSLREIGQNLVQRGGGR